MGVSEILTTARQTANAADRATVRLGDLPKTAQAELAELTLAYLRTRTGKESPRAGWTEVSAGSAGVMTWWADELGEPRRSPGMTGLRPLRKEIYDLLDEEYELIQKAPGQGSSIHVSPSGSFRSATEHGSGGGVATISESGAGFGTPEHNRLVESAAMQAAITLFEGWQYEDVSADNRGWDITFRRDEEQIHAEVKGVSGSKPVVLLTANEQRAAAKDPCWQLVIVTHALLAEPQVTIVDRAAVTAGSIPIVYRFTLAD